MGSVMRWIACAKTTGEFREEGQHGGGSGGGGGDGERERPRAGVVTPCVGPVKDWKELVPSHDETRFRQLLINVVIATDIADRERRAGERVRWEKAFAGDSNWEDEWKSLSEMELSTVDISLKATVVLEQIVLASDVAHTMQHWLTYVKWNERLYKEMWSAYVNGRAENDPTENWYKGEIGFFDGYIIPLATKLKDCGVFGSAGDEYLGNALRNKAEWIEKGAAIVEEFEAKIKRKSISEKSGSTRSLVSSASDS